MSDWKPPPPTAAEQADALDECASYDDRARRSDLEEETGRLQFVGSDARRDDEIHEVSTVETDAELSHEESDEEWLARWTNDEMRHVFAD